MTTAIKAIIAIVMMLIAFFITIIIAPIIHQHCKNDAIAACITILLAGSSTACITMILLVFTLMTGPKQ